MHISPQLALPGRQSVGHLRHVCEGQGCSQGLSLPATQVFQKFVSVFLLGSTDYRQRWLTVLLQPARPAVLPAQPQPDPFPAPLLPSSAPTPSCQPHAITWTCHAAPGTTEAEQPCMTLTSRLVPPPRRLGPHPQQRRASSRAPLFPGDLSGCWSLPGLALPGTACSQRWLRAEAAAQTALPELSLYH